MKRFRLGIVGYGNLGRALVKLLHMKRDTLNAEGLDLSLTCLLGRRGGLHDPNGLDCAALASHTEAGHSLDAFPGFDAALDFPKIAEERLIDILVEFTPTQKDTGEPGLTHIRTALKHGIHVATGNKGPILVAWEELSALARDSGLLLGIGCTTGGALPSILNGREAMAGSDILSIEGVLNGTTNFILSRMESGGATYEDALKEAQRAGIAEADPTADVGGWDTAVKLLILANVVMDAKLKLADVPVTGITRLTPSDILEARKNGKKIKLVGKAVRKNGRVEASIAPETVDETHPFYFVSAQNKCVRYVSDTLGDLFVAGGGSGPIPSAAAALRDIVNAWRSALLK